MAIIFSGETMKINLNALEEVKAKITNLKYAPNNRGYSQDYIGITIYGNSVNAINYGYSFTSKAK